MKMIQRIIANLESPRVRNVLGSQAVSIVQNRIVRGSWTPNSSLTKAVKGGDKPLRDSGRLLASISYRIEGSDIIVSTVHPSAALLHKGGTIRPKKARFLTIPAGAKTRKLMRQYGLTPRECIEGMKADGYSIWMSFGKGGGNMFARKGKRGQMFVLFILKRSVTVPARPFMELGEAGISQLSRRLREELKS